MLSAAWSLNQVGRYRFVPEGAMLKQSAPQSIANPESTLTWNLEEYDDGGWHDNVTNNSRITTRLRDRLVRLKTQVEVSGPENQVKILQAGAGYTGYAICDTVTTINGAMSGITPVPVPGTTYFESNVNVGGSGRQTVVATAMFAAIETIDPRLRRCLVERSVAQGALNITTTVTPIPWGQAIYDNMGAWDVSAPTRLTAKKAGLYRIGCNLSTSSQTGQVYSLFTLNGGLFRGAGQFDNDTVGGDFLNYWSAPVYLNAGDYIECSINTATTTRTLTQSVGTWFAIEEVPWHHKYALVYHSASQSFTGAAAAVQLTLGGTVYDPHGMKSGDSLVMPAGCTQIRQAFGLVTASATGNMTVAGRKVATGYQGRPCQINDTTGGDSLNSYGGWVNATPGDAFTLWFQCSASTTVPDDFATWMALECR